MKNIFKKTIESKKLNKFLHSIWFFPSILTIILIVLSILQISGSSIGMYHNILYGNDKKDSSLIFGQPQGIRSDEWAVNSQKIIAQVNDGLKATNDNVGNGENETMINDVPTLDWSVAFKPHNLGFLIFGLDNAFALRWWLMSYFLVLSSYFFILLLLPGKKLLASLLALAMLFSPFFQWWYAYGTMGSVYYCLFGAVVFAKLLHSTKRKSAILWALLLSYIATCFVFILYPPFQIPCALILIAFAIGYSLDNKKTINKNILKRNLLYFSGSIILALIIVGLFIYQRYDIISTISNTAYPGQRVLTSGGYSLKHLLASNLSPIFQSITKANGYFFPGINATNQSEASNFILLTPFLMIPMLFLRFKEFKKNKKINYTFLALMITLIIMLAWMFVPGLGILGKITLLDKTSTSRILIGIGLLNFILTIKFIKFYSNSNLRFSIKNCLIYSLLIIIFYLLLDFSIMKLCPTFIDYNLAVLLAFPFAIIVYLLIRKYFRLGMFGLLLFTLASTFYINPLYKGTETLTQTPLSQVIQKIGKTSDKKWISEDLFLENIATVNGEGSLSGVYVYPQLDLWKPITTTNQKYIYNRYAHVTFMFDRNKGINIKPTLVLVGGDQFKVKIEPCDEFLKSKNAGFIITQTPFQEGEAPCASLVQTVIYPIPHFYIYRLTF